MEPNTDKIRTMIENGADIRVSHHCGGYNELISMHAASIVGGTINMFTSYISASPTYSPNGQHYTIFHNHTLKNQLTLARTVNISGDGSFGGLFGLPSCDIIENWSCEDQRWMFDDCWEPTSLTVSELIKRCVPVKVRIDTPDYTVIVPTCVIIEHDDGEISIRTDMVGLPTENGLDIVRFSINTERIVERRWHAKKTPARFSPQWVREKMRDVVGVPRWSTTNREILIDDHTRVSLLVYNPRSTGSAP